MIIIKDKSISNDIYFPRVTSSTANTYNLVLTNMAETKDYTFTGLTDNSDNKMFYKFTLNLAELPNNEYKYTINSKYIGLLRIGDYKPIYEQSGSKKYQPTIGGDKFYEG